MKHNKKENEISLLCEIASTVSDNISDIESILNGNKQTNFLYTDTLYFDLLQTTDKNYFTPVDREDIFVLACHIQNLNDEINMLKNSIENNRFFSNEKIRFLFNRFNSCISMLRELEKIPKCNGITQLYLNFSKDNIRQYIF